MCRESHFGYSPGPFFFFFLKSMDVFTLVLVLVSYNNLALNNERWYQYMDIIKEVLIDLLSLQYPRTRLDLLSLSEQIIFWLKSNSLGV